MSVRCWCVALLMLNGYASSSEPFFGRFQPVKIGIILENSPVESLELRKSIDALMASIANSTQLTVTFDLRVYSSIDPFGMTMQACRLIQEGAVFLITQTSCPTSEAVQSMTHSLGVPHIYLPSSSDCGNLPRVSSSSFPVVPSYHAVNRLIGEILYMDDWKNYLLMYDDYFSLDFVRQLDEKLKESAMTKNRLDSLNSDLMKLYDPETTGDMQSDLIAIRTTSKYTNLVVLASQEGTLKLLNQSSKLGLIGFGFKWVVANFDVDVRALQSLHPSLNTVFISRALPAHAFSPVDNTVKANWNGYNSRTGTRKMQHQFGYLLSAVQLAIQALEKSMRDNPDATLTPVGDLRCFSGHKSDFGVLVADAMRSTNPEDPRDYFGVINDYFGCTFYNKENGEFSAMPNLQLLSFTMQPRKLTPSWQLVSQWLGNSTQTIWQVKKSPFRPGRTSLDGATLKIVTVVEEPFIIKVEDPEKPNVYDGYCIDVLKAIQQMVADEFDQHFDYVISETKSYGVEDEESSVGWDGLVGEIISGRADMAVAGMIRSYKRESVVDFTAAYMDYGVGILIRKPQPDINIYGFMTPLTMPLWCLIAASALGASTVLYFLASWSPYERLYSPGVFTFGNSVWWVMGALMLQGGDYNPKAISGRLLGNIIWIFSVLLVSIYTANLAAFLTVSRLSTPIESLQDLAAQNSISYGTKEKSSLTEFFEEQAKTDPMFNTLWSFMNDSSREPKPLVRELEDGYERVLKSSYAFMWDYPVLQYQKKRNCDYMTVGKPFNQKKYVFAVPKNSGYLSTITLSILTLQEQGTLEQIRQKWFEGTGAQCSGEGGESSALEYDNIGGIFSILLVGFAAAFVINLLELIWYKFIVKRSHCDFPKVMKSVRSHFTSFDSYESGDGI